MDELNLSKSLSQVDFVIETIRQIEKDFSRCNVKIRLENCQNRDQLEQSIYDSINNLSVTKLQQLIYLIDIPEKEFLNIISKPHFYQALSETILRREALKIIIRKNY